MHLCVLMCVCLWCVCVCVCVANTCRTVMKIEPSFDDHTHKHKDRAIAVATL